MSIASRIEQIENHISNAYDKIEDLGQDLTNVNKNINNIATELDNIYSNLPKVTGTGTETTLENTKAGKMVIQPRGNTSQNSTIGYNILNANNLSEYTSNGITFTPVYTNNLLDYILVNGTATAVAYMPIIIIIETNKTYRLSGCPSNGSENSYKLMIIDESAYVYVKNDYGDGVTFTPDTYTRYQVRIRIASGYTANNLKFYPMLAEGTEVLDYEPYTGRIASPNPNYPQPIKNVTGDNSVNIRGINYLNEDLFHVRVATQNTSITHQDGKIIINGNAGANGEDIRIEGSTPFLTLKPGKYTFLFNEATTDWNCEINLTALGYGTYKLIKRRAENQRIYTVTIDSDFDIYNMNIHFSPNTEFTNREFWLMILKGEYTLSNAPSFERYFAPIKKQLTLDNIELCKIGDYSDLIFKNESSNPNYDNALTENGWYKKSVIGKINSYNGETITTNYISTTGGLDIGATIYYVLEELVYIQITDTTLINQLENLDRTIIQGGTIIVETESDEENAQLIVSSSALG